MTMHKSKQNRSEQNRKLGNKILTGRYESRGELEGNLEISLEDFQIF